MLDYLAAHAEAAPESVVFTVLRNGEDPSEQTTFAELWRTVQHLAAAVRRQDMVGRTALLVYQEPLPFVKAFLACQLAGVIPVPVPFARGKRQMARLLAIVQNAQAAAVCCCEDAVEAIRQGLGETVPEALQMLATDQPPSDSPLPFMPMPAPDDIAFIQYTSGSTGEPK